MPRRLLHVTALAVGAVLGLAACASRPIAPPSGVEAIHYETQPGGPICWPCDRLRLSVYSNGEVRVIRSHTPRYDRRTRTVRWRAQVSPEAYRRFRDRLEPYRGNRSVGFSDGCEGQVSDADSVKIIWRGAGRPDALLHYDFGCDANGEEAKALKTAPRELGLRRLNNPVDSLQTE